ncbi:tRNA lysidine(34) synthetase TilS [Clostridium aminobutyricum]|uniref:tRNA(Ile)-lysidine synthase n=1 Tax=Clostridium aminobutyricum TaxID=33953 RepID=A0A939IJS0_CLOAM|nr:tRNA lysidine(34) synthetase TilS [Clostridium aminobutyricum]MBN7774386.1 tRNA lysidine(34) synthetase TilS [Clostridium aminobutyricum]
MVESKVKSTIIDKNLIKKNEHIIIGLSGGPDSVCLFNVLINLSDELSYSISAVHVNHKFRPGAAEEDQAYVEELCRVKGIECQSFEMDCNAIAKEKGLTSEEAGRMARYESFYKVAADLIQAGKFEPHQIKIAVAQNLNDQAETMLMRIIRGTGTDGLVGIEYAREGKFGTTLIRPLLDVSRNEIESYCTEKALNPRIDHTNLEPIYTRNKIRLNLIPLIQKEFNENITEALNRLSKIAKEDKDYFDTQVSEAMEQAAIIINERPCPHEGIVSLVGGVSFGEHQLKEMHPAIRHRVIKRAFETIGLDQGISAAHIEAADKVIIGDKASSRTDFPKGYAVSSSYGEVRFYKNDPFTLGYVSEDELKSKLKIRIVKNEGKLKDISKNGSKRFAALDLYKLLDRLTSGEAQLIEAVFQAEQKLKDQDTVECVQQDSMLAEILNVLQIRNRRQGDWMTPLGMNGRKKLQDMFVDEKVYKECRNQVPLVCIGDEVIWIIGDDVSGYSTGMKNGRISENYKLTMDTEQIVLLEYLDKL